MTRKTCARCDKALSQPNGRGRRRKYCSTACKNGDRDHSVRWADEPFALAVRKAVAEHGPLRPLQGRLAELGWRISPATISNWQTGRTLPPDSHEGRARVMA